jgi:glucosamine-6-phosphate deaminase
MSKEMRTNLATILVYPDSAAASSAAAEIIAQKVRATPSCVLGMATGGTPIQTYRELIRLHVEDGLDFSSVTTFNLDEYVGLAADHPQSYRHYMQQNFFDHVNIDPARTHVPDGVAVDSLAASADYEADIVAAGGIDLQLLGIGHNGHIAFNEPGSPRGSRTRVVELSAQTIEKNSRFFDSIDEVPRQAVTMGIATILEAKRIVMLAFGPAKAEAVRLAIEGESNEQHPASLLQGHPSVTFVLDEAAADRLRG